MRPRKIHKNDRVGGKMNDQIKSSITIITLITLICISLLIVISISPLIISNQSPKSVQITPPQKVMPIPAFTPTPTPTPIPHTDPMITLARFDYNNDASLDANELAKLKDIYFMGGLTPEQESAYIEILGRLPRKTPSPKETILREPLQPPQPQDPPQLQETSPQELPQPRKTPPPSPFNQFTQTPIPKNYYSSNNTLPTNESMYDFLANSKWVDEYELNAWDCSQMSAYMEYILENSGYHTVIRIAKVEGSNNSHAWILVEFNQEWLAYECTDRFWVFPDEETALKYSTSQTYYCNPSMYDAGIEYEDIYELWDDYQYRDGREIFISEFGWWK